MRKNRGKAEREREWSGREKESTGIESRQRRWVAWVFSAPQCPKITPPFGQLCLFYRYHQNCVFQRVYLFLSSQQIASLNMGRFVKILFTCPLDCSQDFWQLPVIFSNVLYDQQESSSQHFECSSVPNRSNTWVTNLTKIQSLSPKSFYCFVMGTQA